MTWLLYAKNTAGPVSLSATGQAVSPLFDAGVLVVLCVPAALIVSRQPGNPIGWLLAVIGLGAARQPPPACRRRSI